MTLRVLDLFSGIGGFSLGLERAGMRTVAFCEIDPFCRQVLAKHWPGVSCHDDVRTFRGVECDVICGGFPCQDISFAGKGAGISGERSGLWGEYARLIGELRPSYAIVENVAALLVRGLGRVLGDLAEIGYDAEWYCIPASAVGAPHRRDRIWIVAYPASWRRDGTPATQSGEHQGERARQAGGCDGDSDVADADKPRLERWLRESLRECAAERAAWQGGALPDADDEVQSDVSLNGIQGLGVSQPTGHRGYAWRSEPDVGRVANGVPSRVDRLKSLGNSVVPQIPEIIGRAILRCAQ